MFHRPPSYVYGILIVYMIGFLSVIACQQKGAEEMIYGGGLIPRGLHPNLAKNDWNEASCLLLSRLFQINEQGELEPDLVESYTVSEDRLTYTFTLRRDVTWHDGLPFTADDVEYTFRAIFDTETETAYDDDLNMVASFSVTTPETFVVTLKTPSSSFLSKLSDPGILPKHILVDVPVEDINNDAFDRNPVGTGPYRLAQKVSDAEWVFEWNNRYYRPLENPIPRIRLRVVPDDDERARQAAAGAFHITQIKPQHIGTMEQNPDLVVYRFPSGAWRGMPQNLRRSFIKDKRVRQAISHAIDRDAIVREAAMGAARAAYLPVPPGSPAYDTALFTPERDIEKAKALLAAAGWKPGPDGMLEKDGRRFEYRIGIWKDEVFRRLSGDLVKQQLAEVGIPVDLDLVDNTRYQEIGDNMGDTHDTIIGGWSGLLDPDMNLSKKFTSDGSQNYMQYSNPDVDRLLAEGRAEPDGEKRKAIYRELLTILRDDAVFIPIIYPEYIFVAKKTVQGLRNGMTVDSWYHFTRNAYKWSLEE